LVRKILQWIFRAPLLWCIHRIGGSPVREIVHAKLSNLLRKIQTGKQAGGPRIPFDAANGRIVIMSDLHKGSGDAADDFRLAQNNYIAACYYYLQNDFTCIALGDVEELWENNIAQVIAAYEESISLEQKFIEKQQYYKVVGNHDLFWCNTPYFPGKWLRKMYGKKIPVFECMLLQMYGLQHQLEIFLTHGHQGDRTSDGNKFSKWFVANIWSKVQAYLDINPNSPSKDFLLRDRHNKMMYEWSAEQNNTVLITGHTHKPVFASRNHMETLTRNLETATRNNDTALVEKLNTEIAKRKQEYITNEAFILKKPSYFNTGCCCFEDGDMTLIELADQKIQLVKWTEKNGEPERFVLQEMELEELGAALNKTT
jgi:predicted phosphodiesterase